MTSIRIWILNNEHPSFPVCFYSILCIITLISTECLPFFIIFPLSIFTVHAHIIYIFSRFTFYTFDFCFHFSPFHLFTFQLLSHTMNLGVVESVESRTLFRKMKANIEKVVAQTIVQKKFNGKTVQKDRRYLVTNKDKCWDEIFAGSCRIPLMIVMWWNEMKQDWTKLNPNRAWSELCGITT